MSVAIRVENLGKRFNRYHTEKPVTFMEAALSGLRRLKSVEEFWALRGVSLQVAAGEMLGVIGHNGAGKSTLLQLLGKVAHPTEGRITMQGRVGALLDLGAGFHGDLTGRENVFVTAIVAGLSHREVTRCFDSIVAFAELASFIDNPVRTYSSGMMMRLAFSVAVHTNPEILLVDEFLSVGDLAFQAKCLAHITAMKEQGCAIMLVSHDAQQVETLCDRALWLSRGKVVAYGEPSVVTGQYVSEMRSQTQKRTPSCPPAITQSGTILKVNENRFGSLEAEITDVQLSPSNEINSGDPLQITIAFNATQTIHRPIFSISLSKKETGEICFDSNTKITNTFIEKIEGNGIINMQLDRIDLLNGEYFINIGIYEQNWSYAYDYHWHAYSLFIRKRACTTGMLDPPHHWEFGDKKVSAIINN
jgi:lipopolysaccharide transport system ATP-binding protein